MFSYHLILYIIYVWKHIVNTLIDIFTNFCHYLQLTKLPLHIERLNALILNICHNLLKRLS